jgi:hypothetical protein
LFKTVVWSTNCVILPMLHVTASQLFTKPKCQHKFCGISHCYVFLAT